MKVSFRPKLLQLSYFSCMKGATTRRNINISILLFSVFRIKKLFKVEEELCVFAKSFARDQGEKARARRAKLVSSVAKIVLSRLKIARSRAETGLLLSSLWGLLSIVLLFSQPSPSIQWQRKLFFSASSEMEILRKNIFVIGDFFVLFFFEEKN